MARTRFLPAGARCAAVAWLLVTLAACGGGGGSTDSAAAPVAGTSSVTQVSAAQVAVGGSITVIGRSLDQAARFSIGSAALTASSVTSTTATLTAGAVPVSGVLEVTDRAGNSASTIFAVSVYQPIAISGFSPASARAGETVTVSGSYLDTATSIRFGTVAAAIASRSSAAVTVLVPAYAQSGVISVVTPYESRAAAGAIVVRGTVSPTGLASAVNGATTTLTITGNRLSLVAAVHVGATTASVQSATENQLVATVPVAAAGTVTLVNDDLSTVEAGSYVGGVALSSIELGQTYIRNANEPMARMVTGKAALVRVALTAQAAHVTSPMVTVTAVSHGVTLGALTLQGPATLPTSVTAAGTGYFSVEVPAAWITSGVSLVVDATVGGTLLLSRAAPAVTPATRLALVLVPMVMGGVVPTMPSVAEVRDVLKRLYPYAAGDISVEVRAPFTASAATTFAYDASNLNVMADAYGHALAAIEQLRRVEAPHKWYYGVFPESSIPPGGYAGLGYVNQLNGLEFGYYAAIGSDTTRAFTAESPFQFHVATSEAVNTMVHELGHVHSLSHASCGGAAGPDAMAPYANGNLGPQPLYWSDYAATSVGLWGSAQVGTNRWMKDVMGYCAGLFFSDYNYNKVQVFAEAKAASPIAELQRLSADHAASRIAGVIRNGEVRFFATSVAAGPAAEDARSETTLRVTFATGDVHDYHLALVQLSFDELEVHHFSVNVPLALGAIESMRVLVRGQALPTVR
jgi:hypothetical protein